MKRQLGSLDSLGGASMSICPSAEERSPHGTNIYSRDFQSILDDLDEEGCIEETEHSLGKKRRLGNDQVKALEKNFEVENKLDPERKVKLAQELGLQPRQVAVWFQNRRARWKTKQLERDYGVLKANYDTLKLNLESLQRDNEALLNQIKEMKEMLNEEKRETSYLCIKEEVIFTETENKVTENIETHVDAAPDSAELDNNEAYNSGNSSGVMIFPGLKDGSSDDSDSSAILNEESRNSPNAAISSSVFLQNQNQIVISPTSSSLRFNRSSPEPKFEFFDSRLVESNSSDKAYQSSQFVKVEEHNFFNGEESCNIFSDEQAPSLHWYCPDQWN